MDLNQKQVRVLAVVLVIHVILLTLTRRDLRARLRRRGAGHQAALEDVVHHEHHRLGGLLALRAQAGRQQAASRWPRPDSGRFSAPGPNRGTEPARPRRPRR